MESYYVFSIFLEYSRYAVKLEPVRALDASVHYVNLHNEHCNV